MLHVLPVLDPQPPRRLRRTLLPLPRRPGPVTTCRRDCKQPVLARHPSYARSCQGRAQVAAAPLVLWRLRVSLLQQVGLALAQRYPLSPTSPSRPSTSTSPSP